MFNSSWYNSLISPPLSPPAFIFAPVWFVLYLFIFISLGFYIISNGANKKLGYIYFFIQLILNLSWTPIFFGMKNILLALIVVILLDIFVALTIFEFSKVSKLAAGLLFPYIIWILFATYLNSGYLFLN